MELQRNYEWQEMRRGKFTASSMHRLMGVRGMGKTGETYVLEKVTESLGVDLNEVTTYAMQYGADMERYAKQYYESAFNCEITEQGFIVAEWNKEAGCSPDGIIDKYSKGVEFKCPYNPVNHTQNLLIKSAADLKDLHPEYYWQIQMCLAVTGLNKWDFISFHPEFTGMNRMITIEILSNSSDIMLMKTRINEAVEMKSNFLKLIKL
jgi:hypothetical protein